MWSGTPPQTKHHSCDKMDQVFPLQFCILQAIKNWTVGRPGNEAKTSFLISGNRNRDPHPAVFVSAVKSPPLTAPGWNVICEDPTDSPSSWPPHSLDISWRETWCNHDVMLATPTLCLMLTLTDSRKPLIQTCWDQRVYEVISANDWWSEDYDKTPRDSLGAGWVKTMIKLPRTVLGPVEWKLW